LAAKALVESLILGAQLGLHLFQLVEAFGHQRRRAPSA
jgi:hypothetical protein